MCVPYRPVSRYGPPDRDRRAGDTAERLGCAVCLTAPPRRRLTPPWPTAPRSPAEPRLTGLRPAEPRLTGLRPAKPSPAGARPAKPRPASAHTGCTAPSPHPGCCQDLRSLHSTRRYQTAGSRPPQVAARTPGRFPGAPPPHSEPSSVHRGRPKHQSPHLPRLWLPSGCKLLARCRSASNDAAQSVCGRLLTTV